MICAAPEPTVFSANTCCCWVNPASFGCSWAITFCSPMNLPCWLKMLTPSVLSIAVVFSEPPTSVWKAVFTTCTPRSL